MRAPPLRKTGARGRRIPFVSRSQSSSQAIILDIVVHALAFLLSDFSDDSSLSSEFHATHPHNPAPREGTGSREVIRRFRYVVIVDGGIVRSPTGNPPWPA